MARPESGPLQKSIKRFRFKEIPAMSVGTVGEETSARSVLHVYRENIERELRIVNRLIAQELKDKKPPQS